ncbi:hypothetical protein [Streptomyces sp. NPDC056190]|uniref:hypothetical protein n=1 Tax=Streptomyces sp. NPDC056190 TaxID=3345741 RepID=UPI0035D91EF1
MTNRTAPTRQRPPGAKMTIRVYTVTSKGARTPPRTTVTVPYGHKPVPTPMSTALPPCACPIHRTAGSPQ